MFSFLLLTAITAHAQSCSITSRTIAAGGGASSGGIYSATGAIARNEATPASTGGICSLGGGFNAQCMALQQTDAPPLIIRGVSGSNVQVVWGATFPAGCGKPTAPASPAPRAHHANTSITALPLPSSVT